MEEILPSAVAVLDRLKSEGTFDQFRKICLAAIEEEPSYRAQKEHVEILSRRFLQDYDIREGKTKNEVRSKLRASVLEELKKPGVQASQSVEVLIEKTLEAKSSEIFRKILEIIDRMQRPSPPPLPPDNILTEEQVRPPPPSLSHDATNGVPTSTGISGLSQPSTATSSSINTFELPLDLLPSFNNPVKCDIVKKPLKQKTKPEVSNKENAKTRTGKHETKDRRGSLKGIEGVTKQVKGSVEEAVESNNSSVVDNKTSASDGEAKSKNMVKNVLVDTSSIDELKSIDDACDTILIQNSEEEDETKLHEEELEDRTKDSSPVDSSVPDSRPIRRSARLASIGEEKKESLNILPQGRRKRKESVHLTSDEENDVAEEKKMKSRKEMNIEELRKPPASKKRAVISSSESEEDIKNEEDNQMEIQTPIIEDTKPLSGGRRSANKRASIPRRRLSSTPPLLTSPVLSPPSSTSSSKQSKRMKKMTDSSVVVTRYNRRVKPNRQRYYPGEQHTESEDEIYDDSEKEEDSDIMNKEEMEKNEQLVCDVVSKRTRSRK